MLTRIWDSFQPIHLNIVFVFTICVRVITHTHTRGRPIHMVCLPLGADKYTHESKSATNKLSMKLYKSCMIFFFFCSRLCFFVVVVSVASDSHMKKKKTLEFHSHLHTQQYGGCDRCCVLIFRFDVFRSNRDSLGFISQRL